MMINIEFIGLSLSLLVMLIIVLHWFRESKRGNANFSYAVKSKPDSSLYNHLQTLNLNLPPALVIAGIAIVAFAIFMLLLEIFPKHIPLAAIAGMAVTVFCFNSISDMAKMKIKRVEKGLAEAMDMMKAALTSGQSPHQAIALAAQSGQGTVKHQLTEMLGRLDMGCSPEQAINHLTTKYNCIATRLFAQVIIARYQSGSDLTFMLDSVNRIVRDRQRHQLQIDTHLSGTRYAAILCGGLPYILIPILLWQQPDWFDTLLKHPSGPTYLGGALFLQFTGYLWLRRISRIEQ
ncbi:type II secretion system F family protein [Colwellia sp. BRX8-3]|nr:type II secretion system F family protein [Colwellia sp. BRX9-1]MBA6356512.1 type II secretion system F family protein [Colwellia sp. BRX8-3]MBA6361654.1 type II secretion system F family protein [Colwellia sp. BRX8-6]MBA6364003.1 type II secretion system F family protein [Colwellia sp. BRX8-8]MBA6367602.1 type II secretion system F family protein [Colwellia sp. BRX8-5]MBA6371547.1 type II secretion system F family protein [Colwellia sp. BRX8-4]MBA6376805.1 type II secretion system F famil